MSATSEIDNEVVEASLDTLGVPWKRREDGWVVPSGPRWPYQVSVTACAGTLRVEAVLVSWDELGPTERSALECLLARAERCQPGVRFELDADRALAWRSLPAGSSERALTAVVARVAESTRRLAREAGALLNQEVAQAYLRFFGAAAK
jgi:hypothetical protein